MRQRTTPVVPPGRILRSTAVGCLTSSETARRRADRPEWIPKQDHPHRRQDPGPGLHHGLSHGFL